VIDVSVEASFRERVTFFVGSPMNYQIRIRSLARVFVDAQALEVPPEDAVQFARNDLGGYLVGHGVEAPSDGGPQRERVVFISRDRGRLLTLLGSSFDYAALAIDATGSTLFDFPSFARDAARVLAMTCDRFGRVPFRIALVQEGLLGEMTDEEMSKLGRRLLTTPPRGKAGAIFEWDWKLATNERVAIAGVEEMCNLLVTIKRGSGVLNPMKGPPVKFDRVRVDLDFNTSHANTRGRFDSARIGAFFDTAIGVHSRLAEEAQSLIGGSS
jgi:hypothetical protein